MANDYTTLTDLKAYLDLTGTGDDGLLADLITAASRMIDAHTGRFFTAKDETRQYDAVGDHVYRKLLFLDADLISVTAITNGDGSAVASGDYRLRPLNFPPYFGISLTQASGLSWCYDDDPEAAISVNGRWGFAESVPGPVALAALKLAAHLYRVRDAGATEARVIGFDGRGYPRLPGRIPGDVYDLLRPYIRLKVAV